MLQLMELSMVKDQILRQAFIKVTCGSRTWLDPYAKPIAIRALRKGSCTFKERAGSDERPNFSAETGLSFSIPNCRQNHLCVFGLVTLKILRFGPSLDTLES